MKQKIFLRIKSSVLIIATALNMVLPIQAITVSEYVVPTPDSQLSSIVAGPDGNLWFAETKGNKIGRITPAGVITEFPLPTSGSNPSSIAAGPDGNLWFTESNPGRIGRITPAGVITEFPLPNASYLPYGIIAGTDGNLWFVESGNFPKVIGKITTNGAITEYQLPSSNKITGLASDAEGNIWLLQPIPSFLGFDSRIGKLAPNGTFTEEVKANPHDLQYFGSITTGPDGNVWYSVYHFDRNFGFIGSDSSEIVRLTSNGSASPSSISTSVLDPTRRIVAPVVDPARIITGPDGNFWFLSFDSNERYGGLEKGGKRIGRVGLSGSLIEYETAENLRASAFVKGPDNNIWYLDAERNVIGKLTPDNPAGVAVTRASSYIGGTVAADSIASLWGSSLTTTTEGATTLPLATALAGVSVKVKDSSGAERAAPLFFASPSQINFLVPSGAQTGNADVSVVSSSGQIIATGTMIIDTLTPGLFSADATGGGLAAAVVQRVRADNSISYEAVAVFNSAQNKFEPVPIDLGPDTDWVFLALFGTGIRNHKSLSNVTAYIRGVNAQVVYAGPQGQFEGLDQVNILLPRSLAGRGLVNVVLTIDGRAVNAVQVSIR